MRRSVTAESIPTKFCTSTLLGDVVIYLTWHRNWLRGFGGVGCENGPLPLTLALASNTAYCATAHTRENAAVCDAAFSYRHCSISFIWTYWTFSWPWPRPFQGRFFIGRVGLAMVRQCVKVEVSRFTRYEAVNGGAKCRKWGDAAFSYRHCSISFTWTSSLASSTSAICTFSAGGSCETCGASHSGGPWNALRNIHRYTVSQKNKTLNCCP